MKKNKKQRIFKYIAEYPAVSYRALDKNGNMFIESQSLEDVLEEAHRFGNVTFERMEVFETTDGYKPYKPMSLKKLRNPKPSPTGCSRGRHIRRGYVNAR